MYEWLDLDDYFVGSVLFFCNYLIILTISCFFLFNIFFFQKN